MAQDYYKTSEVEEHPSLTRAVLQTVSIFQPWLQCRLILSLPRILPIKSNKTETWTERKYLTGLVKSEKWIETFFPHNFCNNNKFSTHKKRVIPFNPSRSSFYRDLLLAGWRSKKTCVEPKQKHKYNCLQKLWKLSLLTKFWGPQRREP